MSLTGVHQILPAASAGDAITNSALEIRSLLRRACSSEVYARHIAPDIQHEVRALDAYRPREPGNVLVYHASIGEPLVHAFLLSRREPIVLVYHNVTPPHYFEPFDSTFAELLALGRTELSDLRHRVAAAIAVSEFNAAELESLGYRDVRVIPPITDPYRLARVSPTPSVLRHLADVIRVPYFLYVGQILPHKRPDFLVKAVHVMSTYLGVDAMLILVGHPRLERYRRAILELIRELNLPNVHFVGPVATPDLAAFYSRATAVVTASEHEGFCVPLVEAMGFGKPIVARACAAVPETLGSGGLLIPADAGPTVFAEALLAVLQDDALRGDLGHRATLRAAGFDARRVQSDLLSVVLEAV